MLKQYIKIRIQEFIEDSRASVTLEALLMFPLLIWAYVSTFVFFDAFRTKNANMKAAYTISDMLSRQTNPVNQAYLDGLNEVYDFLASSPHPTWIRVSVVTWDEDDVQFEVEWSESTKSQTAWTTESLDEIVPRIPAMSHADTVIIVETHMTYEPMFRLGLRTLDFDNFVVTSPRFAPRLCWDTCVEA